MLVGVGISRFSRYMCFKSTLSTIRLTAPVRPQTSNSFGASVTFSLAMSVQQDSADSVDPSSYAISIFGRHDKNGDGSLNRTVELLWTCC
jgi:hypothetical protein